MYTRFCSMLIACVCVSLLIMLALESWLRVWAELICSTSIVLCARSSTLFPSKKIHKGTDDKQCNGVLTSLKYCIVRGELTDGIYNIPQVTSSVNILYIHCVHSPVAKIYQLFNGINNIIDINIYNFLHFISNLLLYQIYWKFGNFQSPSKPCVWKVIRTYS